MFFTDVALPDLTNGLPHQLGIPDATVWTQDGKESPHLGLTVAQNSIIPQQFPRRQQHIGTEGLRGRQVQTASVSPFIIKAENGIPVDTGGYFYRLKRL